MRYVDGWLSRQHKKDLVEKIATYDEVKTMRMMIQVEVSSLTSQLQVKDLSDQ